MVDIREQRRTQGGRSAQPTGQIRLPAAPQAPRASHKRLSSVATAMALLKSFSEEDSELGVTELARRLKLAKSTVHRLAATLVSEGMLEQNPENGRYRLGITLFGLGALVRRRMNLSSEARQELFALREATQETVQLAVLDDADIMYVYNLESTQAIRVNSDIGVRKPAFCTASGRAVLAFEAPEAVDAIIANGLDRRAPKTDTDPRGCAGYSRKSVGAAMRSRMKKARPACGRSRRRSGAREARS